MNVSEIRAPKIVELFSELTSSGWMVSQCPWAVPVAAPFRTRNSARKIGIWMSSGRQEANGLALFSL